MKHSIRNRFLLGFLLFVALFSTLPSQVFAAGNTASVSPPAGTSQTGNTFVISVDGFVAASLFGSHSANGTLTFPASLMKVTNISTTGATFTNTSTVTPNNTSGTITFSQSSGFFAAANNQSVHLFTVTFQSLAAGTANLAFSNFKYDTGSTQTKGGTYTITNPPAPAPSPTPTPKLTPTPTPTANPKPTPSPATLPVITPSIAVTPAPSLEPTIVDTPEETPAPMLDSDGGLKINNVKVSATRQENSVTFELSDPDIVPTFSYGTTKNTLKTQADGVKQSDESYKVTLVDLKPGNLYYFTIKAATGDNLQGATYSGTLTTRGYPVQLTIQQNNLLLPGAKVSIDGRSFVANKNAFITTELSDGDHKASITAPDATDAHEISFTVVKKPIPSNGNPATQNFILNVAISGTTSGLNSSLVLPIVGAVLAGIVAMSGLILFAIVRRRKKAVYDNTGIDADMLASSYGTVIDTYSSNTPVPNLETNGTLVGTSDGDSVEGEMLQQSTFTPTVQDAPIEEEPSSLATTDQLAGFDPAVLPLPPTADPSLAMTDDYAANTYSEVEQLAPEITNIEATEKINSDEPSAVYNDETGELDIIHHTTEVINEPSSSVYRESEPTSDPSPYQTPPQYSEMPTNLNESVISHFSDTNLRPLTLDNPPADASQPPASPPQLTTPVSE